MPRWASVQYVFDPLLKLLFANNEDVIRNVLLALKLILPGSGLCFYHFFFISYYPFCNKIGSARFQVIPRFLDLLSVPIHGVVEVTLSAIFSMLKVDQEYTNVR